MFDLAVKSVWIKVGKVGDKWEKWGKNVGFNQHQHEGNR